MNIKNFLVPQGKTIRLKDYPSDFTGKYKDKSDVAEKLEEDINNLSTYQDILYAQNDYALLIIVQAMDAAGKDGTIKHVFSGVNPQGCQVFNFKAPSTEELDHDFLWRCMKALPERGRIGIFNRSYYEEVLVVRVHEHILEKQQLPDHIKRDKNLWKERFQQINNFEKYLVDNGIIVLKFFLHVSKEEQKKRFLERLDNPDKNWKFSLSDAEERKHWDKYMEYYEDIFSNTSTKAAPWHIIPADNKWFTHLAVGDIINKTLKDLHLHYPKVTDEHRENLRRAKEMLLAEKK